MNVQSVTDRGEFRKGEMLTVGVRPEYGDFFRVTHINGEGVRSIKFVPKKDVSWNLQAHWEQLPLHGGYDAV